MTASMNCTARGGTSEPLTSFVDLTLSAVVFDAKAPTYLMVPRGNGTVINISGAGLRYTGEQSFDLVVVNNTANTTIQSAPIPTPWNNTTNYTLKLGPGLTTLIVPRELFLNSTFGYALLRNRTTPVVPNWTAPALLGESEDQLLRSLGFLNQNSSTNPYALLSCYWQNRTLPAWNFEPLGHTICQNEYGAPANTAGPSPRVLALTDSGNGSASNMGGAASDPTLENSSTAGAALQAVFTLNLTDFTQSGHDYGIQPSLDLLLAALLDNYSGGVNGSLVNVTASLDFLGVAPAVLAALPNSTIVSDARFGPPLPVASQTSSASCGWLVCIEDTLSAGWAYLANGKWISALSGYFTGFIGAIESYLAEIPLVLKFLLVLVVCPLCIAAELLHELTAAGEALWNEVASIGLIVEREIFNTLLLPLATAVKKAFGSYDSGIYGDVNASVADVVNGGGYNGVVTNAHAAKLLAAIGGGVMVAGLLIGAAVTVVAIVVAILCIGSEAIVDFIITNLINLGATAAFAGLVIGAGLTPTAIQQVNTFITKNVNSKNGESIPQADWGALSQTVQDGIDMTSVPLDIYLGVKLVESKNPVAKLSFPTISLCLDLVAIALDAMSWGAPNSLALAAIAFGVSVIAAVIARLTPDIPGAVLAGHISEGMAWVATGLSGYDLSQQLKSIL